MSQLHRRLPVALCAAGSLLLLASTASAEHRPWRKGPPAFTLAEPVLAGAGCPIETPDGRSLMVASGRAGGKGGLDIWVLDRDAVGAPWSEPKNLPGPINTSAADFCPSPFDRSLYFVSERIANSAGEPVGCGGGDIYLSRQSPAGEWSEPEHLACEPYGPNTPGTERSPSLVETWYGTFLFYSTNAGGVNGPDEDIYVSIMDKNGHFGRGWLVNALSTPDAQDQMPTVRQIDEGGLAVTFNSDRSDPKAAGGQDAYYATAAFLPFWWTKPQNLGPNVNTAGNETRVTLSHDGERLYVGRGDVYVSARK
jgi:hypothetical protein